MNWYVRTPQFKTSATQFPLVYLHSFSQLSERVDSNFFFSMASSSVATPVGIGLDASSNDFRPLQDSFPTSDDVPALVSAGDLLQDVMASSGVLVSRPDRDSFTPYFAPPSPCFGRTSISAFRSLAFRCWAGPEKSQTWKGHLKKRLFKIS